MSLLLSYQQSYIYCKASAHSLQVKMLHRLTKTVPKQCLVYFTIDDTTAVVPTKKILMVEGARPITKGEKVMVTWNGQGHEAYILELSGKHKAIIVVYMRVS